MIVNLLTGLVALIGMIVFLMEYAVTIDTLPLWIIILGVLLLPLYDWVNSLRTRGKR